MRQNAWNVPHNFWAGWTPQPFPSLSPTSSWTPPKLPWDFTFSTHGLAMLPKKHGSIIYYHFGSRKSVRSCCCFFWGGRVLGIVLGHLYLYISGTTQDPPFWIPGPLTFHMLYFYFSCKNCKYLWKYQKVQKSIQQSTLKLQTNNKKTHKKNKKNPADVWDPILKIPYKKSQRSQSPGFSSWKICISAAKGPLIRIIYTSVQQGNLRCGFAAWIYMYMYRMYTYTWNLKHPFINGCFNWMISNLDMGNGWKSPNIHLKLVVWSSRYIRHIFVYTVYYIHTSFSACIHIHIMCSFNDVYMSHMVIFRNCGSW